VARRRGAAAPDPQDHPDDDLPEEEVGYDDDAEYDDYYEEDADAAPAPARRSGGLLSRWADSARARATTPVDESQLKPTDMRGNEALYGYILAAELVVVSVFNLVFTHGKGAPAHPPTTLSVVGLIVSVAFGALVRTHNRFIVSFAALIAAFFVTLPRVPSKLFVFHLLALILPLIYALVLMQRQRKATLAAAKSGSGGRQTPAQRRAEADARRRERRQQKRGAPPPPKVAPSRRYTPPKAKRPRR
jgi:hypothetical protein